MTSPSVDLLDGIMPYGVTVSGGGSSGKAVFVTSSPQASNDSLSSPGGPVRVSASWSGPEAVRLTLGGVGYPVQIPAGGGPLRDGCRRLEERGHSLSGIRRRVAALRERSRHNRGVPTPTTLTAGAVVKHDHAAACSCLICRAGAIVSEMVDGLIFYGCRGIGHPRALACRGDNSDDHLGGESSALFPPVGEDAGHRRTGGAAEDGGVYRAGKNVSRCADCRRGAGRPRPRSRCSVSNPAPRTLSIIPAGVV